MKKIRILMFLIISVVMIMCLASCTSKEANTESPTNDTVESSYVEEKLLEVKYPFEITYLLKDTNGNIIKVMLYNQETKETIIQEFFYEYDYRTEKFIIYETRETVQNKANHVCQNGKDGVDGQNGLTPFIDSNGNWWIGDTDTGVAAQGPKGETGSPGKDCNCNCNESNTTITRPGDDGPNREESNPVGTIIYHDNYVKITIQKYFDHLLGPGIRFYIENESTDNLMIMTDEVVINGYSGITHSFLAQVEAGAPAIEDFIIWDSDFEKYNIETLEDMTFKFTFYGVDGSNTYWESEELYINLNK